MKIQKNIKIDLNASTYASPIKVVQYDTGIQLVLSVRDFAIPDGTTATVFFLKPSGKFVFQEDDVVISDNTITIDVHNQAFTEYGRVKYQVELKNGSDIITTFSHKIEVEKSLSNSAEESKIIVKAFDGLVSEKVADFETRAEAITQALIETIPDDYTELTNSVDRLYDNVANAIKGNVSGSVVAVDDVSPIEHNLDVWVHGKNLAKRTNTNNTETSSGITYTVLDDGRVSASGTATDTAYYLLTRSTDWAYQIPIRKGIYTVPKAPADGCRISVGIRDNQNTERVLYYSTSTNAVTFEVKSDEARFDMILCVDKGYTVNGVIFEPQLEKGETVTAYTPYIDPTTVKVRASGKNIYKVNAKTQTVNGVTFTVNNDGTVVANGTAEKTTFLALGTLHVANGEKYRLSGSPSGSAFDTYMLYIHNNTTGADTYDLGSGKVFEGKAGDKGLVIVVYEGATVNNLKFYPMVVSGEESGNFEPYIGVEYTPKADGSIEAITSVSPNMTLLTETDGIIIDCEYNRDSNKVIEKLVNAIIALGGTV